MSLDCIPELCEHLRKIPDDVEKVDFMVVSQGGDPNVAWRITSLLRERFSTIGVLIPFDAHSAATILAFGADEIIMHPFSCLGPIDSQITVPGSNPMEPPNQFSVEDIRAYLAFVEEDLGLTGDAIGANALNNLSSELKPTKIGLVKKSMKFTQSLGTKLLETHMKDPEKIKSIVEKFNSFSHHGYTISRKEAADLGLPVITNKEIDDLMWDVWNDAEVEMKCRVPFDPLPIVASRKDIMIKLNTLTSVPTVENVYDESVLAILESTNVKSFYPSKAVISAVRGNNLSIMCNVSFTSEGWVSEISE